MRVLLTTSLYPTPAAPFTLGGAELFVRYLSERLAADGHEVEVVRARTPHGAGDEIVNGVKVFSAGRNNIFHPFGEPRRAPLRAAWHLIDDHARASRLIAQRIAAFRPHVLHSNNLAGLGADTWRSAAELGVPVLHTLHDYYLTCPRCSRFSEGTICKATCRACTLTTLGRRRRVGHVSAVVGVSHRILDIHHREGLFRDTQIQAVVRNASHLTGTVVPDPSAILRIGYMGRITADKGIQQLIPALAGLPADRIRLVVAGRIKEETAASLRALAPQSDIRFLGFVRPQDFFRQVDVVVVPSLWEEPGSLVIEEALSAGRPVVVSPHGGSPEAIEPGVDGWVVEPEAASLAALLGRLAENTSEVSRMQDYLMRHKVHRTLDDVSTAYLDLYARVGALPGMAI